MMFPGWFKPGETRGVEATGMGLLIVFAQILFVGLALLIPGAIGAGTTFLLFQVMPLSFAIVAGAAVVAASLILEAWIGTLILGGVFERFDASSEG